MLPTNEVLTIDPTPRRADGEYMAHVRISFRGADGSDTEAMISGDLAGFHLREEAIAFAKSWAQRWLSSRFQ